jgi:hypothetical protein
MFKVLSSGAVERYAEWKGVVVVGFETVAMAAQVWVPRRASVGATSMRPSRLANMPPDALTCSACCGTIQSPPANREN